MKTKFKNYHNDKKILLHLHKLLHLRWYHRSTSTAYLFLQQKKASISMNNKNTYPALSTKKSWNCSIFHWHIDTSNEITTQSYYTGPTLSYWVLSNLANFFACKPIMQNRISIVKSFIIVSAIKTKRQTFYLRFLLYYQYCTQNHVG